MHQFAFRFGDSELLGVAHHDGQLAKQFALLSDEQLRVANDIDEQDMTISKRRPGFSSVDMRLFYLVSFGAGEATSFWKRGSFRSGSNIGSSRSSAGVSGTFCVASGPAYGSESSFCKAE